VQPDLKPTEPQNTWMRMSNVLKRRTDLTANAKLVYAHMLDKYVYFSRQQKSYHENMQDIGDELGMTKMTVSNCIKKLATVGLVEIFKKRVEGSNSPVTSYSYKVKDFYAVYKSNQGQVHKHYDDNEPF
jgi:predicted transcriptional regulator